ncbi:hypothetical protein A2U01_0009519, partial [Trifolium medium]|nr:hypothetical protein [Trifolium medium]
MHIHARYLSPPYLKPKPPYQPPILTIGVISSARSEQWHRLSMEDINRTNIILTISGGPLDNRENHQPQSQQQQTLTINHKKLARPILGFGDHEMIDRTPNKEFPRLMIATLAWHNVSRILIDE